MAPRTASDPTTFRPDIEGVRGLAVLIVVLFHANLAGLAGGFIGVDVFFVISGFLITGLLLREREKTGRIGMLQFYARRIRRLLPAAIVTLLVTLVVALNVVTPLDRPGVGFDGGAAALSLANVRFALAEGDYFASIGAPSPFLHFWSLAVEEQFYLVWPALFLLVARVGNVRRRLTIALIAVVGLSFAANLLVTDLAANWAFYSLPTRAWELASGGLLAVAGGLLVRVPGRIVGLGGWLGFAAVGAAAITFDSSLPWPGAAALVPAIATVLLLAGGSRAWGPGCVLGLPSLRWLGRISYSLYLVHWPILVLVPVAFGVELGALDEIVRLSLVGLSLLAATLSWALIETPFRTGLPSLARRPRRTLSLGMSAMLAVVVVAALPSFGAGTIEAANPPPSETAEPSDEPWPTDDGWDTASPAPSFASSPSTSPSDPAAPSDAAAPAPSGAPAPRPTVRPDEVEHGRLPDDVVPALTNARADEERLRRDGCLAFEPVTVPRDCVYGVRDASYTVALVGDSHAAQWFGALERLAKHEGWRVVTFVKVACPFIDMRVRNVALKREYRECAAFNEATIERLAAVKPDITLVAMSRFATRPLRDADDTVAAKGAAVGRMVARLPGRTMLIVDTPSPQIDVPGCLSAHQGDVDACAIPARTAFSDHLGDVEAIASEASGAGLIDLTSRICVDRPCPVVVNGMIVFRDHSHMTATFSRSLAPALGAAIQAVLDAAAADTLGSPS